MYSRFPNFKIVLVLCIGLMGGCSDSSDSFDQPTVQFSYSVLTSTTGNGLDLLNELNNSVLPNLREVGAQEYATWSWASDSSEFFEKISEDKLVVMLRWEKVNTARLQEELEAMTGVGDVSTSLWVVNLRGGEDSLETGPGFYIHRFNRYLNEDVDEALSLSEQMWETWEPYWGSEVAGVWRELNEVDESNGVTRLMRIAWYRDMEHWLETRNAWEEPESLKKYLERAALELDDEGWSANLAPN